MGDPIRLQGLKTCLKWNPKHQNFANLTVDVLLSIKYLPHDLLDFSIFVSFHSCFIPVKQHVAQSNFNIYKNILNIIFKILQLYSFTDVKLIHFYNIHYQHYITLKKYASYLKKLFNCLIVVALLNCFLGSRVTIEGTFQDTGRWVHTCLFSLKKCIYYFIYATHNYMSLVL